MEERLARFAGAMLGEQVAALPLVELDTRHNPFSRHFSGSNPPSPVDQGSGPAFAYQLRLGWRTRVLRALPELRRLDGLTEHFLIEFDPDLADMTGLFIAKKVAGPAYIHVIGCQGEPGAKRVQCLHDLEATPRMRHCRRAPSSQSHWG